MIRPDDEALARLPKWAREWIATLERRRDELARTLEEHRGEAVRDRKIVGMVNAYDDHPRPVFEREQVRWLSEPVTAEEFLRDPRALRAMDGWVDTRPDAYGRGVEVMTNHLAMISPQSGNVVRVSDDRF